MPCSSVSFNIKAQPDSKATIKWHGVRLRVQVTITDSSGAVVGEEVMTGHDLALPWDITADKFELDFTKYQFDAGATLKVTLRKMT